MNEEKNENVQSTNTKKAPDKKMLIIIGAIVAVIALVVLVVLVVKPGSGEGPGGILNPEEDKIVLTTKNLGDGKILVTADSTKKGTYDVAFNLVFYGPDKEQIRLFEETVHCVEKGKKAYQLIDINGLVTGEYTYEVKITKETLKDSSLIFTDKIKTTTTKNDTEIIVHLNNTADKQIDAIQVAILFTRANEPVGYTSQFVTAIGGQSLLNEIVYIPTDASGEPIKFDNHEVIIAAYNHEK